VCVFRIEGNAKNFQFLVFSLNFDEFYIAIEYTKVLSHAQ